MTENDSGKRSVSSGRDMHGNVIVNGDNNTVFLGQGNPVVKQVPVGTANPEAVATARKFDIAILTVIGPELHALMGALEIDDARHKFPMDGSYYFSAHFQSRASGRALTAVIHCIGTPGNADCAAATARIIEKFRPESIFLMGIAAGRKGKCKIGDAVIPRAVVDTTIKVAEAGQLQPRPSIPELMQPMRQMVQTHQLDGGAWHELFLRLFPDPIPAPLGEEDDYQENVAGLPLLHEAAINSDDVLLRDPAVLEQLAGQIHQQIKIGEMEAGGFVKATKQVHPPVPWLVVRGVSDFGDTFKNDLFHKLASCAAASYLVYFLLNAYDANLLSTVESPQNVERQAQSDSEMRTSNSEWPSPRPANVSMLRRRYLTALTERIGMLNLAQIDPNGRQVELERVYVDAPTDLVISVEVQDWRIVDWWVMVRGEHDFRGAAARRFENNNQVSNLLEPRDQNRAALQPLVDSIQKEIEHYREENPDLKPDDNGNRWRNGPHTNTGTLSITHVAAAGFRLVVLGGPGSGKSTFVRYLALCLAGESLKWNRPARLADFGHWSHGLLTPVYVELRKFVNCPDFPNTLGENPTADHLWKHIESGLKADGVGDYIPELRRDLSVGKAVLILDGLDEVPFDEGMLPELQRKMRELARSLNIAYPQSRIIVASRPYAYEGWTLPGFAAVTLAGFDDEHRIKLAMRLYQAAELSDKEAAAKGKALNVQLGPVDPELKDRPLFLTLMATIFLHGGDEGFPTRKGTLYRQSIMLLLDRWTKSKPDAPCLAELLGRKSPEDLFTRLAALAYDVHAQFGATPGTPEIAYELLIKHLKPLGKRVAVDVISYLSENAGIIVCPGQDRERDVFHFAHRSFQEYLAACHIVAECRAANSFSRLRELILQKVYLWREPARLVADILMESTDTSVIWNLLDDLIGGGFPPGIANDNSYWWAVWLAAAICDDQAILDPMPLRHGEKAVCNALRDSLVALLETCGALRRAERAFCGRVLSILGDPRPGVGLRPDGLPDIEWCKVPEGPFLFGSDPDKDLLARDDEQPQRTVGLPAFHISKFPVTYAQFKSFVDDPQGYANNRWWEGLPEEALEQQQNGADERDYQFANHPIFRVSWYDAVAFCKWLSNKLGNSITLPTEEQWEKAARGTDGRIYPYGDEFDWEKGNSYNFDIRYASSVGIFPNGVSPCGALDMSGNVWEWTLTEVETAVTNIGLVSLRAARGGAWDSDYAGNFRCACRDKNHPTNRFRYVGFRCVSRPD